MTENEMAEKMWRHAIRRAHSMLPAQEVEDAAQHAMVGVVRATRRLDPSRDPWPLLTRVVTQELAMYARGFYSRPEEARESPLEGEQEPLVAQHPLAFSKPVEAALGMLPEPQRLAVVEHIAEGRTKQQAGAILGVSDVTIGNRIKRALPALRLALEAA